MLRYAGYRMAYAFDPGDKTGVCIVGDREYLKDTLDQEGVFKMLALDKVPCPVPTIVFYEEFISRPALFVKKQIAPENIGAIKYWAYVNNFSIFAVQPSQTHKLRRGEVKEAGWIWDTEHEFDAMRIMIYGLTVLHYKNHEG